MLAVVASSIGPSAVYVNCSLLLAILESNVTVRLRHLPGISLFFEVIDHVRQRVLFQKLLLDGERIRADDALIARALEKVLALGVERIEINRPEIPVTPLLHWTGGLRFNREYVPTIRLRPQ